MVAPLREQCPECGLKEGEVIEVRTQATKRRSVAGVKPGVRFVEMPTVERLYQCTKCGHEFTKEIK
jgi:rubredoxin